MAAPEPGLPLLVLTPALLLPVPLLAVLPEIGWPLALATVGLLLLASASHVALAVARLPVLALGCLAGGAGMLACRLVAGLALPPLAAWPLAALIGLLLGLAATPLLAAGRPLTTAAVSLVLMALAAPFLDQPVEILLPATRSSMLALAALLTVGVLLAWQVERSALGRALHALAQEPRLAIASGAAPLALRGLALGLVGALAAAAGPLLLAAGGIVAQDLQGGGVFLSLALAALVPIAGQGALGRTLLAAWLLLILPLAAQLVLPDLPDPRPLLLLTALAFLFLWRGGLPLRQADP